MSRNNNSLYTQDKINFAKKQYNNEIAEKTLYYQKKFHFETSPRQGHEFWNNEADAFKHTFGAADVYFKYGNLGSTFAGIGHENETPNNPQGEWNMDSWNNNQGREIAKEIQKEYGDKFMKLPQQQRDDIIAVKVMDRMHKGKLITRPDDTRKYNGFIENATNWLNSKFGQPMGYAAPVDFVSLAQNLGLNVPESFINLQNSFNSPQQPQSDLAGYTNPVTGDNRIFTREDIGEMSQEEFDKNEKAIIAQLKDMNGLPANADMRRETLNGGAIYVNSYTRSDRTDVKGYYRSRPKF